MKVAFGQISAGYTHFIIKDTGWFPVEELLLQELQHVEIDLLKKDNETVVLEGELRVSVKFFCDRCGEIFDSTLAADFIYLFKIGIDASLDLQDMECSEEDCNTVYLIEPVIDIGEILREQVLLTVPERKICSESCKGLCPRCGVNMAHEVCRCSAEKSVSPFAVLKKIKNNPKKAG
jgi:uncharacterized protein